MTDAAFPSLYPLTLPHGASEDTLRRTFIYSRSYFYMFLLAIALCWSPLKPLAYLAPWLGVGVFLLLTRSQRALSRLLFVLLVWGLTLPLYALLTPNFVLHSAVLTLLTYGAFIFVFVVPTKSLAHPWLLERMLAVARWVLLFEASWGIGQGILAASRTGTFDGATGDAVAGTIRPFAVYPDFSNPMFAVNVTLLLFCLLPYLYYKGKGKVAFVLGSIALVLASVLHVLIFAVGAFLVSLVIYYPSFFFRKKGSIILVFLAIISIVALFLLSTNFSTLRSFVVHTVEGRTPRAQVLRRVFTEMPNEYPWMPIIGIGPGQFSSRAGLIGTGMYFGGPANPRSVPFLPEGMSTPFRSYVWDLWLNMSIRPTVNDSSSTYKPFFSWLSIYVEYGAIAVLVTLGFITQILWRLRRSVTRNSLRRLQAMSLSASVLFVFMLGAQENYWETSQALLVGLLLMKALYANLVYGQSRTKFLNL